VRSSQLRSARPGKGGRAERPSGGTAASVRHNGQTGTAALLLVKLKTEANEPYQAKIAVRMPM
jgi:hypothetical protein